jgi:DNA polymerase I
MTAKLEDFFSKGAVKGEEEVKEEVEGEKNDLVFKPDAPQNLPESYFVAIQYDGEKHLAFIKLYEPKTQRIYFWYDNTGHKPYCLSNEPVERLQQNEAIIRHSGFDHFELVERYDALKDENVQMTMIVAKDPLAIGGRPAGCIRDMIKAWEADIKYVENFIYDRALKPGMPYKIENGELVFVKFNLPPEAVNALESFLKDESKEYKELAIEWMRLLECPVPEFKRAAIDIEVYSPTATRVPDPREAEHPVICASILGSDGKKRVLLLKRLGIEEGSEPIPEGIKLEYYDSEEKLLIEIFKALLEYPFILTFNGDDFDLKYLWHRAQRLGFTREQIPIEMGREAASLKYGVHIDLYKFFFNKSIQVYAFGQKYREVTLNEIGESLIELPKKEVEVSVPELTYRELAAYCFRDAEIVMNLTTFNNDLVMKLIMALSRISFMAIEDVARQGVSSWIRSMIFNEHRKRGYLIPRSDDILSLKGVVATEAVIKGKKYKGAIVVEPLPGVHFNVAVLDFASLYPSIIKIWNLGYETILCPHVDQECRNNKVPGTPHWVCKKRRALESLLIGSLRDLRVNWYKPKSRDTNIPQDLRSWYSVVQNALKVVLNASYGVFGAEKFALYCPPVAEATAAIGRYAITKTIEKARSLGVEVFYGDTDSIFLGSPNLNQLEQLIDWSKNSLRMELEVDKNYRYLALSSRKKNYLGVHPDGSVDIKGLTGKKRHVPEFLKKVFYEMIQTLSEVKSPEEFEKAKEKIKEIVKDCYLKLRNRQYSLEDLAFSIMISKPPEHYVKTTPQHVKAAYLLAKRGVEVKPGDLISFVKVVGEPGVKPVQLASINEIEFEKYVEYIRSTFDQVLDALGVEFEDLIGITKLEKFFPSSD